MKFKSIIVVSILSLVISCQNSKRETDNDSIRPAYELSESEYFINQFNEVEKNQLNNHDFLLTMNHSNIEVFVEIKRGNLYLSEPKSVKPFYELEDGKLEIINNGEFGGALNFIPNAKLSDTITIFDAPINYVFNFKNRIYFLVGIVHGEDEGGALFELERKNDKFSYKEVVRLDSAPEAVSIYKNKILIAGYKMFTIIENFEKDNIVKEAFWRSLHPNSIAVKNDDEVYIGMKGGYSKLSLKSKDLKFYKYKEEHGV